MVLKKYFVLFRDIATKNIAWTIALLSGALCLLVKGLPDAMEALQISAKRLVFLMPVMIGALLLASIIQAMVPHRVVQDRMGEAAGKKSILWGALFGALIPAGAYAIYPLVASMRKMGATDPATVAFLTAWSVLSFHRILAWELPLMGAEFALLRYVSSLPLPLVGGAIALVMMSRKAQGLAGLK